MLTILRLLLVVFIPFLCVAQTQTPRIINQKIYGGGSSERFYTIKQTTDGGFIAAGNTNSYLGDGDIDDAVRRALGQIAVDSNNDGWVIKLDANYKIQWQRVLGGNGFDGILALQQTSDGGYILTGYFASSGGDNSGVHPSHNGGVTRDALAWKLNADGSTAWLKLFGGGGDDQFEKVEILPNGNFLFCGITNSNDGDINPSLYHDTPFNNNYGDAWLICLDKNGNFLWQRIIGGGTKDSFTGMDKTTDGNYILGGFTNSDDGDLKNVNFGYDRVAWITKITPDGTTLWQHTVRKPFSNIETRPYSILTSKNGDFYLGGVAAQDYSSTMDFFLTKFNANGEYKWFKTFGGSGDDWARSLTHSTSDDGVFISGYTLTNNDGDVSGYHAEHDGWIVHVDTAGNAVQKIVCGGSDYDYFWNSTNTTDGRAIFGGYTKSHDFDLAGITKRGDLDGWIVELNWGKTTLTPCSTDTQRLTQNVCSANLVFSDTVAQKNPDGCVSNVITVRVLSNQKNYFFVTDTLCNPANNKAADTLNLTTFSGCDSTVILKHTIKRTGDVCDDGNANTINDVVQADCSCKGERNPNAPATDLAVSLSVSPNYYKNYAVNTFTTVVRNVGLTDFVNVVVGFPYPKNLVDAGVPVVTTKGVWYEYSSNGLTYEWRIPVLKAGDSAVLSVPLFVLLPDGNVTATATLKSSFPEDVFKDNNIATITLLPEPIKASSIVRYTSNTKNAALQLQNIFPQPISDKFFVTMSAPIDQSIVFLCYDALGRVIFSETRIATSNVSSFEFSLQNVSSGVYFLQARLTNGENVIQKIMKQ